MNLRIMTILFAVLVISPVVMSANDRGWAEKPADVRENLFSLQGQQVPAKEAAALRALLRELAASDAGLEGRGRGRAIDPIRIDFERHRAAAWLQAWRVFSRLAAADPGPEVRGILVGADADPSALDLLLLTYRQLAARTQILRDVVAKDWELPEAVDDPLRIRLWKRTASTTAMITLLGDWPRVSAGAGEGEHYPPHTYWVPDAEDLIGAPSDDPALNRETGILTFWALVNLQLDTWRDRGQTGSPLGLNELIHWLDKVEHNSDLAAFASTPATSAGEDAGMRLRKISAFLTSRDYFTDEEHLEALVQRLTDRRLGEAGRTDEPEGLMRQFTALREAAMPLPGGESLPQAEILLRYLILITYRNQGAASITDVGATGLAAFWKQQSGLETPFTMPGKWWRQPESAAFVRWNQPPSRGHFVRGLADAAAAVWHFGAWDAQTVDYERRRFGLATDVVDGRSRRDYARDRENRLRNLEGILKLYLADYFQTTQAPARLLNNSNGRALRNPPGPITRRTHGEPGDKQPVLTGQIMNQWLHSATDSEAQRIATDLALLYARLSNTAQLELLIVAAHENASPAAVATALRSVTGLIGLTEWNVHSYPTRTFNQYASQVRAACNDLDQLLSREEFHQDLEQRFFRKREELEALALEQEAAQLATRIAELGNEVAGKFEEIATRQEEIALLETQIAEAVEQARGDAAKSADLRLGMARKARELAIAELAALEAAVDRAREMVAEATTHLEAMQPRLLSLADDIERQRKRSGFFGILRGIATVVGAVLAPFTGGASLQVVAAVNQALSIAEKIDAMDFSDLGAAVANIGTIVNDLGAFGDLALGELKLAGQDGHRAWADVKGWVRDRKGDVQLLEQQARELHREITALGGVEFSRFATALANDLPVSLQDGKLTVDLGKAGITLGKEASRLEAELRNILDAGGVWLSDVRSEAVEKLPFLRPEDAGYRDNLRRALDDLVLVWKPAEDARLKIEEAKDRIVAELNALRGDADEKRKRLEQILGGLMIVRKENGVVAVERPIGRDVEHIRAQAEALARSIFNKQILEVKERIDSQLQNLNRQTERAQQARSDEQLRQLAQGIPQHVENLRVELYRLEDEFVLAQGRAEEAKAGESIAQLDLGSAEALLRAANLGRQAAGARHQVAMLEREVSSLQARQATLELERRQHLLQAQSIRTQRARAELRWLHTQCLRWGFDPLTQRPAEDSPFLLVSTLDVGTSGTTAFAPPAQVQLAADGLLGMLKWIRILNVQPGGRLGHASSEELTLDVFERTGALLAGRSPLRDQRFSAGLLQSELQQIEADLADAFGNARADSRAVLDFAGGEAILGENQITWFGDAAADRPTDLPSQEVLERLPARFRSQALGWFSVTLQDQHGEAPNSRNQFLDDDHLRLALVSDVSLEWKGPPVPALNKRSLRFYLLAPDQPAAHPALALDEPSFRFPAGRADEGPGKPLDIPFSERETKARLEEELLPRWNSLHFSGAYGRWVVVLMYDGTTDQTRRQIIEALQPREDPTSFELRIPILSVPTDRKHNS